jgi:hypothetical protein
MNVPRREGKRRPFNFGRKKNADSANTLAAIGAMAKSGALRDAGPKPTPEERANNHYEREDVKYEAQYGDAGRAASGERLPKKEALRNAGKKLDANSKPGANNGVRSATTWEKK